MTLSPWKKLLLLVPLAAALHAWEEVPRMSGWLAEHFPRLGLSPREFAASALIFALLHAASILPAWNAEERGGAPVIFLLVQGLVLLNVFSHAAGTLLYLRYSPGLASALCLNLPLPLFFFHRAIAAGRLSRRKLLILLVAAGAGYAPLIFFSFSVGRILVRLFA